MPSSVTLKAAGLNSSPNQLETPEGSLSEASNIIIKRDNTVESRRGYQLYGTPIGSTTDRAKQLLTYRNRILRHYGNTLQFDTQVLNQLNQSIFDSFAGTYIEPQSGRRIRAIEMNGNLYFTTNNGIQKISALTASDLTTADGFIIPAGGVKALDPTLELVIVQNDQNLFLPQDSVVAYRIAWAYTDNNNNLIIGTPSQNIQIYNPLINLLIDDVNQMLLALDDINQGSSLITFGQYFSSWGLTAESSPQDVKNNLVSITNQLDTDIKYTQGGVATASYQRVTNNSGILVFNSNMSTYISPGDQILVTGATGAGAADINGNPLNVSFLSTTSTTDDTINFTPATAFTGTDVSPVTDTTATVNSNNYANISVPADPAIPATDQNLVDIQTYLDLIIKQLQSELTGVIPATLETDYIDGLDITTTASVTLTIPIPQGITTNYFLQIYRTQVLSATGADVLTDLSAGDEDALVYEAYPTAAQLTAGEMIVNDNTPDAFRGANLYTNAITGQGILQSNDIPPIAKDVNKFKNVAFYANTSTLQQEQLNLLGVQQMLTDYGMGNQPNLVITDQNNDANTYTFVEGLPQISDLTFSAESAGNYTGKYFTLHNGNDEEEFYFWYFVNNAGTDPAPAGLTGVRVAINTAETANNVATKTMNAINALTLEFTAAPHTLPTIRVTNVDIGFTTGVSVGTLGGVVTISTVQGGTGDTAQQETTVITTVADVAGSLASKYFTMTGNYSKQQYYFWYKVSGVGTDPALAGQIGVLINIATNDGANTVATATNAAISALSSTFTSSVLANVITVVNVQYGFTTHANAHTSGFTVVTSDVGALNVLLSTLVSPAQAVEETSRSLIKIINQNKTEIIYGYYLSSQNGVPGQMLLQARDLSTPAFYVLANNSDTGNSFSPAISPDSIITSISVANPSVITTSAPHGFSDGETVVISNSDSIPNINGYWTVSNVTSNTFTIPINVTNSGSAGGVTATSNFNNFSQNDVKPNRVYFSKLQQPEAVPISNYFDVGSQDYEILRIFPLRDSLFVLKGDGLYRISGETAPFNLALFDTATVCIAPDSVDVSNNLIFAWTTQGIKSISESGAQIISRPIDVDILKLGSANYPNFYTNTVGVGYESDFSYLVWTNTSPTDTEATICYRYSSLTGTWTTFDKTNTCAIINPADDRMYTGAGDTDFLEQERKSFDRTDYADREIATILENQTDYILAGQQIKLPSVVGINVGDVLYQKQYVTIYEFNTLLQKLDLDPGLTDKNYYTTLMLNGAADLSNSLKNASPSIGLAAKLVADSGTVYKGYLTDIEAYSTSSTGATITNISTTNPTIITTSADHGLITGRVVNITGTNSTPNIDNIYQVTVLSPTTFSVPVAVISAGNSGSYETLDEDILDIQACVNKIITDLNADTGVSFSNYLINSTTSEYESIISNVNVITDIITLELQLPFVIGDLTIFNGINTTFTYTPTTMGDPLGLKHIREATMMFENKQFTSATISFATDLLPQFNDVVFNGLGPGLFGDDVFGNNYFGGGANSAPLRTYIPRDNQRCRYLLIQFTHNIAREKYSIFGITLTGEVGQSSRAYR